MLYVCMCVCVWGWGVSKQYRLDWSKNKCEKGGQLVLEG